jgi:hypothetical protein
MAVRRVRIRTSGLMFEKLARINHKFRTRKERSRATIAEAFAPIEDIVHEIE